MIKQNERCKGTGRVVVEPNCECGLFRDGQHVAVLSVLLLRSSTDLLSSVVIDLTFAQGRDPYFILLSLSEMKNTKYAIFKELRRVGYWVHNHISGACLTWHEEKPKSKKTLGPKNMPSKFGRCNVTLSTWNLHLQTSWLNNRIKVNRAINLGCIRDSRYLGTL